MKPLTESMIARLKQLLDERSMVYVVNYDDGYICIHSNKSGLATQVIDGNTLVSELYWLD
jgi:hypothetical protein